MTMNAHKKRKLKKQTIYNNGEAFNKYVSDLRKLFVKIQFDCSYLDLIHKSEYRYFFDSRIRLRRPEVCNGQNVSSKEVKLISTNLQKFIRMETWYYNTANTWISPYEMQLLGRFISTIESSVKNKERKEQLSLAFIVDGSEKTFINKSFEFYALAINRVALSLSNIRNKVYFIGLRVASVYKKDPQFELIPFVRVLHAREISVVVDGKARPVYRMPRIQFGNNCEWLNFDLSLLGNNYKGEKRILDVFIQSHAIIRLKERLDLLDDKAVNFTLMMGTVILDNMFVYKNKILFPLELHFVKVGYLLAKVVENKLIFSTFLFITHSDTPEGDKLLKETGLDWSDITFWKLDKLSTLLKFDSNKNPKLAEFLEKAGISNIFKLCNQEFSLSNIEKSSYDALYSYINNGVNIDSVLRSDIESVIEDVKDEWNEPEYLNVRTLV